MNKALLSTISLALLASSGVAQNLLANPDFEGGLTGWTPFGNAFAELANPPAVTPRSGATVCKMFGNFTSGFNVSGVFQAFPAAPGDTFTIDCWSRHFSGDPLLGPGAPGSNWAVMKIAFFDAGNAEIGSAEGTILDGTSPQDAWIDNPAVTGTAPAGTVSVQALLLYLQPGTDGGSAQFDDVEFTSTIVPPTTSLLANPGFETGLSGWGAFGNTPVEAASPPAIQPHGGNVLLKMFGTFTGGFNVSGVFQTFPAAPGDTFTMDCWSRHFSGDPMVGAGAPNSNWAVMKIAFFDGGGNEIGAAEATLLDGTSPQDVWIDNAPISGTAPAGTTSVQALLLYLQPAMDGGAAQFDDVEFSGPLASASVYGQGCSGSNGRVPALSPANLPVLGTTYLIDASNLSSAPLAFVVTGFSDSSSAFGPLPLPLAPLGLAQGCFLLASPDSNALVGSVAGAATYSLPIPLNVGFAGARLFHQAASIDPAVTGGFAVSNGVASVLGF